MVFSQAITIVEALSSNIIVKASTSDSVFPTGTFILATSLASSYA